ncbi:RsmD family RNA methyltransferase [Bacillus alkalicola]|uniref:RsmD family RNA methyltransferase n=2 Tax=Bacillales TaxID=1385 RepID=A0ABS6JPY7_9BACI|nr:RsmD family RNA methyltransferase [Bacillus alkalicola]
MRAFFNQDTTGALLRSAIQIDPSRSPFVKGRLKIIIEGASLKDLLEQLKDINVNQKQTFKVIYVKNPDLLKSEEMSFSQRQAIVMDVALKINGNADLVSPDIVFGLMKIKGGWVFGIYKESTPIWHRHQEKPHHYSTALNTRVARAVVNIAVPNVKGLKVIDPCCGIGTVLIEGLSMGIDIIGSDLNPLVMKGARGNIAYFGYETEVRIKDIRDIKESFDVGIIDMPYNLCSVLSRKDQLQMLQSARAFANKVVVITVEPIDDQLVEAGFKIQDRCVVKKSKTFSRQIIVCQ